MRDGGWGSCGWPGWRGGQTPKKKKKHKTPLSALRSLRIALTLMSSRVCATGSLFFAILLSPLPPLYHLLPPRHDFALALTLSHRSHSQTHFACFAVALCFCLCCCCWCCCSPRYVHNCTFDLTLFLCFFLFFASLVAIAACHPLLSSPPS